MKTAGTWPCGSSKKMFIVDGGRSRLTVASRLRRTMRTEQEGKGGLG